MNEGIEAGRNPGGQPRRLDRTTFFSGAVVSSFKALENTLLPQYFKLEKKIESGAAFIINQIGFDSRKAHELIEYFRWRRLTRIPLIGNVFLLSPAVVRLFHRQVIPGVILTDPLLDLCLHQAASPDKGKAFFHEFAAKQIAIYRGLGYTGAYLGGVHSLSDVERVLSIERSFSPDDWRLFAREIGFARPHEFYLFEPDGDTGLCKTGVINPDWTESIRRCERTGNVTPLYTLSKAMHSLFFKRGRALAPAGARLCASATDPARGPRWLRAIERMSKSALYSCNDCGDCSLAEIAFLCPESQCAKNQRNGPCGGTRDGKCEVFDYECIWARAYDRMKADGKSGELLAHAPVVQDQGLRNSSAWANYWLRRDHTSDSSLLPE